MWKTGDGSEIWLFSALSISTYLHSVVIFILETNSALGHEVMCPWISLGKDRWRVNLFYSWLSSPTQ
jgi:hypothetical protein